MANNFEFTISIEGVQESRERLHSIDLGFEEIGATANRAGSSVNSASNEIARMTRRMQGMDSFARETRSANREMQHLAENCRSVAGQMQDIAKQVAGIAVAWKGFTGLQELIGQGFQYNEQLENAQLGIASVVAATMELVDANGRALQAQAKFNAAQAMSVEMAKKLDVASMQSPAGYTDLLSTFQTLLAPANQLGLQWEDTLDITIKMSNVLSAMGLDMQSLARETQSILTGANLSQSNVASRLGITKEEIQSWKTGAELLENFQKRFEAFRYAGVAVEDTMEAVRAYYDDVIRNASGDAFTSLWASAKAAMLEVADAFYEIDEASGQFRKTEAWETLSTVIDGIGSAIGDKFAGAVKTAVDWTKDLAKWIDGMGADKALAGIGQGAQIAAAGLAGLVVARKAATAEFVIANGVEQKQVTGLRAYMAESAKARQETRTRALAELELAKTLQMRAQREMAAMTANRSAAEAGRINSASINAQTRLTDQLAAANTRLAAAQRAAFASSAVGAGLNTLRAGLSGLVGMLGGPVGIAFTAAAAGAMYLHTRTTAATEATRSLEEAEKSWQGVMKGCTDETGNLLQNLDATQKKMIELAQAKHLQAWQDQLALMNDAMRRMAQQNSLVYSDSGFFNGLNVSISETREYEEEVSRLLNTLREKGPAASREFTNALSDLHTAMREAGYGNTELAYSIEEMLKSASKAEGGLLSCADKMGVLGNAAEDAKVSIRNLKAEMGSPWQMDSSKAEDFIAKLKAGIRDANLAAEGLGSFKELGKLLPNISEKQLGEVYRQYKKSGQGAAIKAIGDEAYRALPGNAQAELNETLSLMKQLESANKRASSLRNSSSGSGSSRARAAATAQADYTGEIERTKNAIESLEQQLGLDKSQSLTEARIKAQEKYNAAISKTNEEIAKQVAQGKLTQSQADTLKAEKEKQASLQLQLDNKKAQERQDQKNVQIAQGQLKFYKELGQLSGNYGNSVRLQNRLLEQQAQKYKDELDISQDLIGQWLYFQELQISQDPMDGAYRGLLKFNAEYADSARQWESISYNFGKSFMSTTRSIFADFIDTGKATFESFKDLFKQFLKDLAWQALVNPVMVSIVGGVTGAIWGGQGTASAATGASSGGGSDLLGMGSGLLQNYATGKVRDSLFGSSGSLMGGIASGINSAVGEMFPSLFASSAQQAAFNAVSNTMGAAESGTASILPTSTFTSALATPAIGAGIGVMASPFVNSLLGLQNNAGSTAGSLIGGGLGTLGGALAGSVFPGVGTIVGAGLGALGSLLGGGIGSLFGAGKPEEPELYLSSGINLWEKARRGEEKYPGGARSLFEGNGYFTWMGGAQGTNFQTAQTAAAFANEVLYSGQVISNSMEEALGAMNSALGKQYSENLKKRGELRYDLYLAGDQLNAGQIEKYAEDLNRMILDSIVDAMTGLDLSPLTIAADGLAANTRSELAKAFNDLFTYANTGMGIEDEESRARFNEAAINQMAIALDNVDFTPLSRAADGFAVDTLDELTSSLEDMFGLYDLSANLQDEGLRKAFQGWAQKAIAKAFADIDLSFLRVDFDKNSFAGLQNAYAATKAWKAVEDGINAVIAPASEFETAMQGASDQFDQWLDNLKQLGWQEDALAEVEAKRSRYLAETQRQLEQEMRQSLALRASALRYGDNSNEYALQSLLFQQANEREQWAKQFGQDHELYQYGVAIQQTELTRALLDQFKAMRDDLLAQEKEQQQKALNERMSALQTELSAQQKLASETERLADRFRRLANSLADYRRDLWSGQDNLSGSRYTEAYKQFDAYLQQALAGDEDAYGELKNKAGELLQLGREQLGAREEYRDLFYDVDQKLKAAQEAALTRTTEADKQLAALNAIIASLDNQQNALQAQLNALNVQTAAEVKSLYTLGEIESVIAMLTGVFNRQTQQVAPDWDWNRLLREKAAEWSSYAYRGNTSWTESQVRQEISSMGMTVEQWFSEVASKEGYTLHAIETTNATLDRNASLDRKLSAQNTSTLNASLTKQIGEIATGNASISSLLNVSSSFFPDAISSMGGLNNGLASIYSGVSNVNSGVGVVNSSLGGVNSGIGSVNASVGGVESGVSSVHSGVNEVIGGLNSVYRALVNIAVKQDATNPGAFEAEKISYKGTSTAFAGSTTGYNPANGNYNGATSTGGGASSLPLGAGIYGSTFSTEQELLVAKTRSLNIGYPETGGYLGRNDWTPGKTRDYIISEVRKAQPQLSGSDALKYWYEHGGQYEQKLGMYASGGIAPANEPYFVGERGPELVVSPQQHGILNNRASMAIASAGIQALTTGKRDNGPDTGETLKAGFAMLANILKQINAKNDKAAHASDRMYTIMRNWDGNGVPTDSEERAELYAVIRQGFEMLAGMLRPKGENEAEAEA